MSLPPALPPRPAPLSFDQRRWTALFSLPFALFMGIAGLFSLAWLPQSLGNSLGWPVGVFVSVASVMLGVGLAGPAWKALTASGPALVVDARGITDNFHLKVHLPWSAIQSADPDYGDGRNLVLTLRPGAKLPGGARVQKGFWRSMRRAFNGGDLSIPLGGLVYDPRRLREALKAHLAHQAHNASDKAR